MATETPTTAGDQQTPSDVTTTARHMGWRPLEEFRGDPGKWVDADEFVKKGFEALPVLQDRYRKLGQDHEKTQRDLAEMRTRLAETTATLEGFREFATKAEERAYKRARAEIESRMQEAVTTGDPAAHKAALDDLNDLEKEKPAPTPTAKPAAEKETPPAADKSKDPVVVDWVRKNDWYEKDAELNALAVFIHGRLLKTKPDLTLEENLDQVAEEVRRRYPERFENEKRDTPAPVLSSSNGSGRSAAGTKGRRYEDLPPDAKEQCDKFCKMQVKGADGKMQPLITREQYVKDYDWS